MGIEQDIKDIKIAIEELRGDLASSRASNKAKTKTVAEKLTAKAAPAEKISVEVTFGEVRKEVIEWITPQVKKDKQAGTAVMQKLLKQFTGGEPFQSEFVPAKNFGAILAYVRSTK